MNSNLKPERFTLDNPLADIEAKYPLSAEEFANDVSRRARAREERNKKKQVAVYSVALLGILGIGATALDGDTEGIRNHDQGSAHVDESTTTTETETTAPTETTIPKADPPEPEYLPTYPTGGETTMSLPPYSPAETESQGIPADPKISGKIGSTPQG